MDRDRVALARRVAPRVETVVWAWMRGYISDAQFERLIAALAREIADRLVPPARTAPVLAVPQPADSR